MPALFKNRSGGAITTLTVMFSLAALCGPAAAAAPGRTAGTETGRTTAASQVGEINIIASHSGRCIEVQNSSQQPGAWVQQADCTGQAGAVWRLQESAAGGGSVNVVNVNSGRCLEVQNGSNAVGALLRQADCTATAGISFLVHDRTDHVWLQPLAATDRKCLEVAGGSYANGVSVRLAECLGQSGVAFHQRVPKTGNDPAREPEPPKSGMERVNVTPAGAQTPGGLGGSADTSEISATGRFVVFESTSPDLVAGDTNGQADVFVRDRVTGVTERVSVSSGNAQGNKASKAPGISADGRYVVFQSDASTLVTGDANNVSDVFLRDLQSGTTEILSRSAAGSAGLAASSRPSITPDGRYVTFQSAASQLVAGDTNGKSDVFVRDRTTGALERVSVSGGGAQGAGHSEQGRLSDNGRYVVFRSEAANLVTGDTNQFADVFVRDRQAGTTERVSVSTAGVQGNHHSARPSVSADGRFVAFDSQASSLIPGQYDDGMAEVFVRDRQTGTTERISQTHNGYESLLDSYEPSISADGRYVAFTSASDSIVPNDTNTTLDVFVRDRQTSATVRVSVSDGGFGGDNYSAQPKISSNGLFVVLHSVATNLVAGDTNTGADLFLRPRPGV